MSTALTTMQPRRLGELEGIIRSGLQKFVEAWDGAAGDPRPAALPAGRIQDVRGLLPYA
jgi:hypothetical protein